MIPSPLPKKKKNASKFFWVFNHCNQEGVDLWCMPSRTGLLSHSEHHTPYTSKLLCHLMMCFHQSSAPHRHRLHQQPHLMNWQNNRLDGGAGSMWEDCGRVIPSHSRTIVAWSRNWGANNFFPHFLRLKFKNWVYCWVCGCWKTALFYYIRHQWVIKIVLFVFWSRERAGVKGKLQNKKNKQRPPPPPPPPPTNLLITDFFIFFLFTTINRFSRTNVMASNSDQDWLYIRYAITKLAERDTPRLFFFFHFYEPSLPFFEDQHNHNNHNNNNTHTQTHLWGLILYILLILLWTVNRLFHAK